MMPNVGCLTKLGAAMHKTDNYDKEDNQGKAKVDGEDDLSYLDRPMISYGLRTIPKPQPRIMVWLRRVLGKQPE